MQENYKIVHIISGLWTGGTEKALVKLLRYWDKDVFRHAVIAFADGELKQDFLELGIKPIVLRQKRWYDLKFLFQLLVIIRNLKPHIIHCRNASHVVIYGNIVAKILNLPLVVSVHGHPDFLTDNPFIKRLWYVIQKRSHKIVTVSNSLKDILIRKGKIRPDKITVIHNGIDLADIKHDPIVKQKLKQELGINDSDQIIGCVGNLRSVKGHRYLIQSMPLILERFPNARLILVGDGPLRSELEQLAEKFRVREKTVFLGYRTDIPELMNIFDIFVLPSLSEGLSNVLLEAMAASKPVVATNVGGNPEVVENYKTGILIPPKNPVMLAQAVNDLLSDESKRLKMGELGFKRVKEHFLLSDTVQKYERIYREIIRNSLHSVL